MRAPIEIMNFRYVDIFCKKTNRNCFPYFVSQIDIILAHGLYDGLSAEGTKWAGDFKGNLTIVSKSFEKPLKTNDLHGCFSGVFFTFCRSSCLTNIYLFKVNKRNTRKCQCQWRFSCVFNVSYRHMFHLFLVFLLLTLDKNISAGPKIF